jgi:hypothetical protein
MINSKKIKIPTGDTKDITEIESYTVKWYVYTSNYGDRKTYHKVFLTLKDANEFQSNLLKANELIGGYIYTDVFKN